MMEYGDSLMRAEWDALMEREREAAQEGTDDLRPPFVLDRIVEVHKIVKAKVGPVEADRILEAGSGHIPHLDSLMRAKRSARREREREAAQATLLDAIWRVVERTVDGDERVAANVAGGSQRFIEAVARAGGGPSGKPAAQLTINRIVLALRTKPQYAHEFVKKGISQLERDGSYALLFAETQNPLVHLFWVIHMHRIEDAFDAALDAAGKIEDPSARKKARKGLRYLLNMHLARRRRAGAAKAAMSADEASIPNPPPNKEEDLVGARVEGG